MFGIKSKSTILDLHCTRAGILVGVRPVLTPPQSSTLGAEEQLQKHPCATPPCEIPYKCSEYKRTNSERENKSLTVPKTQKDDCLSVKEFHENEINISSFRENSQDFRGNTNKKADCCVVKMVNVPHSSSSNLVDTSTQSSPLVEEEQFRKYRCGFTLAETLITLVIIGVIAAVTVPTMVTKYQKEQTVTKLKKTYSALAQTTNRAIADYGPIKTWNIGATYNGNDSETFMNKYLVPYMNVMKKAQKYNNNNWNPQYHWLSGYASTLSGNGSSRFYLIDGTSITGHIYDKRLNLIIDINGDKLPNKAGRDMFMYSYHIDSYNESLIGKLIPSGADRTRTENLSSDRANNCNRTQHGDTCASVIMMDGWKISDDYPW